MKARRESKKKTAALAYLAEKAVRFANTMDEHGEAWDTEADVLRAAVEYASTLSKRERDKIGTGEA
jgi:hypothetical protein